MSDSYNSSIRSSQAAKPKLEVVNHLSPKPHLKKLKAMKQMAYTLGEYSCIHNYDQNQEMSLKGNRLAI